MKRPGSRGVRLHAGGQHCEPDHRREDDGDEPRCDERQGDDGEQRETILPGVVGRKADRQKAENGDQRSGQHGKGGRGIGEGRRLQLLHARLDFRDHHLDRDHGIIDQKAERNDEGAKRDALQADVHALHAEEDDGEHERYRQGNDQPGPEPEAQKAHDEDDGDRLDERLGEFSDGLAHDLGLIGDELELDADRQALHQTVCGRVEAFAEGEIVAARAHVDADADGGLAIDAEHLGGRIGIAGPNLGDVGQFVELPVDRKVEVGNALRREQGAGDVDQHVLALRVDDARRHHRILLGNCREYIVEIELEVCQLLRREVEIDLFVLIAEDLDLADVRCPQELGPSDLGEIAGFPRAETVIGDAIDGAEDVAKFVIEEGADHAFWEGSLDIADLLADLVPDIFDLALGRRFLEVHEDRRLAGLGIALQIIQVRRLLELLFEPVGNLLQGVDRGGTRPGDLDDHGLHRKVGIFLAAELLIGAEASDGTEQHQEHDDRLVADGPLGEIEACHQFNSISGLTASPSASELTPAVTTFSPAERPLLITTDSSLNLRSSIPRR